MDEAAFAQYITQTFPGTIAVENEGDTFFYYNPGQKAPDEFYFGTIKTKDDDYDKASNVSRPGTFRLNIGIGPETYQSMFGAQPDKVGKGDGVDPDHVYTALDKFHPHPVYAKMSWVCILNPSPVNFPTIKNLLQEAYKLAVAKFDKKNARAEH